MMFTSKRQSAIKTALTFDSSQGSARAGRGSWHQYGLTDYLYPHRHESTHLGKSCQICQGSRGTLHLSSKNAPQGLKVRAVRAGARAAKQPKYPVFLAYCPDCPDCPDLFNLITTRIGIEKRGTKNARLPRLYALEINKFEKARAVRAVEAGRQHPQQIHASQLVKTDRSLRATTQSSLLRYCLCVAIALQLRLACSEPAMSETVAEASGQTERTTAERFRAKRPQPRHLHTSTKRNPQPFRKVIQAPSDHMLVCKRMPSELVPYMLVYKRLSGDSVRIFGSLQQGGAATLGLRPY